MYPAMPMSQIEERYDSQLWTVNNIVQCKATAPLMKASISYHHQDEEREESEEKCGILTGN